MNCNMLDLWCLLVHNVCSLLDNLYMSPCRHIVPVCVDAYAFLYVPGHDQ
jgi:hypothetical protein